MTRHTDVIELFFQPTNNCHQSQKNYAQRKPNVTMDRRPK